MGEHLLCKQGVIGSIPFTSTTDWPERVDIKAEGFDIGFTDEGCWIFNNSEEVKCVRS